jgi:hypothetical protein
MAAGESPNMIIDLFSQLETLVAETATLKSQVAGMHPRTPATPTTSFEGLQLSEERLTFSTLERLHTGKSMRTAGDPYYPRMIALTPRPSGLCHSSTH